MTDGDNTELKFHYVLNCPCGTTLEAETEDGIVDSSFAHLREKHPELAEHYERDDILFMALKLRA